MKSIRHRTTGRAPGAFLIAMVVALAACGGDDDSSDEGSPSTVGGRLDQTLVFGGPPECLERPLCLGTTSQELYGLDFKEVKKLDVGGPVTVTALEDGTIDVGLLFTGSSVIKDDFVLLEDDKGLQPADNPTAIVAEDKATDDVQRIIDAVNEKITTDEYNAMALAVFNDKEDPKDVASEFLARVGLDQGGDSGNGTALTVGSKDFAGAQLLSFAYGEALAANGYDITYKDNIGPTETVFPLVGSEIDLYGEYTGTFLTYLEGTPSSDRDETYTALEAALEGKGAIATTPATAQDVNGFYVTRETADKYGISKLSDLTKPASS
jgi:osmoprotectant transport system substrate-binding protein